MKKITLWLLLLIASNALIGAPLHYNFAVTSRQGSRPYQEDAVYPGNAGVGALPPFGVFFGIFDGHGGGQASAYAVEDKTLASYLTLGKPVHQMLKDAFARVESKLVGSDPVISDGSGTTATTLYLDINTCPKAYIANIGDSRTIVLRPVGGQYGVIASTVDHKPNSPSERARIEGVGGQVEEWGVPRINGLALSRSLGDAYSKSLTPGAISAEPDIFEIDLQVGDIVIMASDGLWDVMDNADVCALRDGPQPHFNNYYVKRNKRQDNVTEHWGSGTVNKNKDVQKIVATNEAPPALMSFLKDLSESAYQKGSTDNITVMGFEVTGGADFDESSQGQTQSNSNNDTQPNVQNDNDNDSSITDLWSDLDPWAKKLIVGSGLLLAVGGFGYWLYKKLHHQEDSNS